MKTYSKRDFLSNPNPDSKDNTFPLLRGGKYDTGFYGNHIENNLKANWLLTEVLSRPSSFTQSLPIDRQLRALEAALFMIGYQIPN